MLPKELLQCFYSQWGLRIKRDSNNSQALTKTLLEEVQNQIKQHFPPCVWLGEKRLL